MIQSRKAVVGIGTLIIFIATIVVSLIAAAVLINATGVLQERALEVEEAARERLVTGLEVYSVNVYGNTTTEEIYGVELLTRLRPGSSPVQLQTTGLTLDSPIGFYSAELNSAIINDDCTFDNLNDETEFCIIDRFGEGNTVVEIGDLYIIRYRLPADGELPTFTEFEISLTPRLGGIETVELRTPDLVLADRIRLR